MRALLIDDDLSLCEMLSTYLSAEGFDVHVCDRAKGGVEEALTGRYDILVLDIMMPDLNGLDALRDIRRASDVPIIMLTARGDRLDRVIGLEMGADDYVTKPYDPRELLARIRAVLRRRPALVGTGEEGSLTMGALQLASQTRLVHWQGKPLDLTASEFNVLQSLMRARGAVRSKDDLARDALGRRRMAYDRSLDVHISNIRQKFAARRIASIQIETVRGIGYRIRESR